MPEVNYSTSSLSLIIPFPSHAGYQDAYNRADRAVGDHAGSSCCTAGLGSGFTLRFPNLFPTYTGGLCLWYNMFTTCETVTFCAP
jgi:hypothetical protein